MELPVTAAGQIAAVSRKALEKVGVLVTAAAGVVTVRVVMFLALELASI
jgi:hypothetical protein